MGTANCGFRRLDRIAIIFERHRGCGESAAVAATYVPPASRSALSRRRSGSIW